MPINPAFRVQISTYVSKKYHRRLLRIQKERPLLSISKQVERCIDAHLPILEAEVGLTDKGR